MKHFYHTIGEDWFSYSNFYKKMVKEMPDGSHFIEIGSWKGRSAAFMAVEIINSGKNIQFDCIDSWKYLPTTEQPVSSQEHFDAVYNEFMKNMLQVSDKMSLVVHKMTSEEASKHYENNSIDFMLIDASHLYPDVNNDLKCWFPKIKPGGIISGHDYFTSVHPGVKKAVDEFFFRVKTIPEQNIWYYEKK